MREFKFRAWDGKAMIYEMCMDVDIGSIDGQTFKVNFHTWPNYEFMQYTGLKDKNGVEIYEGDMVGFSSLSEEISKVYDIPNFPVLHIVEYVDCYFMARRIDAPNLLIGLFNIASVSNIFGNIYENPELSGGENY